MTACPRAAHTWDEPGQEHLNRRLYARFHRDVWLPAAIREAAEAFLPHKGQELPLSQHYKRLQEERKLPKRLHMPYTRDLIDVTVVRATGAVFRVLIRAPWNRRVDIAMVLEGDFEVLTAFWASDWDSHSNLDVTQYEQAPKGDEKEEEKQP